MDLVLEIKGALNSLKKNLNKIETEVTKEAEKLGKEIGKSIEKGFKSQSNFSKLASDLNKNFQAGFDKTLNTIGSTSLKDFVNLTKNYSLQALDTLKRIPNKIVEFSIFFKKTTIDIFESLPAVTKKAFEGLKSSAISTFNNIKNLPNFLFDSLKKFPASVVQSFKQLANTIYNLNLDKVFAGMGGFASAVKSGINNLASFGSTLSSVLSGGVNGFANLSSNILNGLGSALKSASRGAIDLAKNIAQSTAGVAGNIAKAGLIAGSIATIGAGVGLAGMVKYGTELSSQLQGARISFETILGSKEQAKGLLNDITAFAKRTPFNRLELIDLSKLLMGSGILRNEVIPTLTKLGNVASGSGAPIENLAYNYAQIKANNRAYTIDLKQFATYGIPIFDKIAKNMNITVEALRNGIDTKDIKVDFQDVDRALTQMTSKGGQYFDLMGKKSNTFEGALSNIKDTAQSVLLKFMGVDDTGEVMAGGLFDMAQQKALSFQAWLNANGEQIGAWGGIVFTKIGQGIQIAWSSIIQPALADFQNWFDTGGKEAIKRFLSEAWERFANFLRYFGSDLYPNIIQPALKQFGAWLADPKRVEDAQNIVRAMGSIADSIMRVIEFANKAGRAIGDVVNSAKDLGQNAGSKGLDIQNKIRSFFGVSPKEGRARGGSVLPGKLYEVGENNMAEMFMSNGRQYMIPGNKGQVLNQQQIENKTDNRQINSGNQINYIYQEQYVRPSFSNLAYNY